MGLRISEIRFRRWADFFSADGEVWCDVLGKGSRVSRVAVHPEIVETLVKLRAFHSDPTWLFPSPHSYGKAVSVNWLRARHAEILAEAGLPHATPHQLRHSHATYLGKAGVDGALVQRSMRHADPKSTQAYRLVFDEDLARAVRRLSFVALPPGSPPS
jgi:integrase